MAEYQQGTPVYNKAGVQTGTTYTTKWKKRKHGRTGGGNKNSGPLQSGAAAMFPLMEKLMIKKNRQG